MEGQPLGRVRRAENGLGLIKGKVRRGIDEG